MRPDFNKKTARPLSLKSRPTAEEFLADIRFLDPIPAPS